MREQRPGLRVPGELRGVLGVEQDRSRAAQRAAWVRSRTDRAAAIAESVALAEPGDVLVIAGKGHEQGQEFEAGRKLPFDDVSVAREALRAVTLSR